MSRRRPLTALQIVISGRCFRACAICPQAALANRWRGGDMDDAVWSAVEPALPLAEYVHLQGWGEPLLHPRWPEFAARARAARCRVGLTTNGDLLAGALPLLVEAGVQSVTVSVAGEAGGHAAQRGGSSIDDVLAAAGRRGAAAGSGCRSATCSPAPTPRSCRGWSSGRPRPG
jgi:MoaA/NifB/PqqE/SkfB family radical SAM enzyme